MFLYLTNIIKIFFPAVLITGLLAARWSLLFGRKALQNLLIGLAVGLLCGSIVYFISSQQETLTAARSVLFAAAALGIAINGAAWFLVSSRSRNLAAAGWGASLAFVAALGANGAFSFSAMIAEQALSATTVLNTELILNLGGILAGACLMMFLVPLTAHLSARGGAATASGVIALASAVLVVPWCADVLLGLMRLELVEVTSLGLSFVAKVGKYAHALPYVLLFLLTVLSLVYFARRTAYQPDDLFAMRRAERRKARGRMLLDLRWFKTALATVFVVLAILLHHDLYASRPPRISTPVNLAPDADGLIKVKIAEVSDGRLHRYSYVTGDGHVVRFFMINRMTGRAGSQSRIGVVYDACLLCGDMGYIHAKNEVICIACNVRIFIPSIGKAGGCNPIPLNHVLEGEHIVVSAEELDKGARYFSEVIPVTTKDPVSGGDLNSLEAPYRYEFKGRTYFFESEASYEKFKTAPEAYAGNPQARYERVQGYPEQK